MACLPSMRSRSSAGIAFNAAASESPLYRAAVPPAAAQPVDTHGGGAAGAISDADQSEWPLSGQRYQQQQQPAVHLRPGSVLRGGAPATFAFRYHCRSEDPGFDLVAQDPGFTLPAGGS